MTPYKFPAIVLILFQIVIFFSLKLFTYIFMAEQLFCGLEISTITIGFITMADKCSRTPEIEILKGTIFFSHATSTIKLLGSVIVDFLKIISKNLKMKQISTRWRCFNSSFSRLIAPISLSL